MDYIGARNFKENFRRFPGLRVCKSLDFTPFPYLKNDEKNKIVRVYKSSTFASVLPPIVDCRCATWLGSVRHGEVLVLNILGARLSTTQLI